MEKILGKIWNGEFCPAESLMDNIPGFAEELEDLAVLTENFTKTLSLKQSNVFEEIMFKKTILENQTQTEAFTCGFKLGVKMITESLKDEKHENT